jgi:hypothetical protein
VLAKWSDAKKDALAAKINRKAAKKADVKEFFRGR